jgi:hypothetical protein
VVRLRGILDRFLNAVGCMDACIVADDTLDNLPVPAWVGQTKVGGIDLNKPRMRRVAEAILAFVDIAGFTASDLAQRVRTYERGSGIRLRAAAHRVRSQETSRRIHGLQDWILTPLRAPYQTGYGP